MSSIAVGVRSIAVKGGIGDFLQCVPFMLAHPEYRYLVASHNDCIQEFFGALNIEVEELSLGRLKGADACPRSLFFNSNPFPQQTPIFTGTRPVVGVHLGGSSYSLNVERRFGFPLKALPLSVLRELLLNGTQYDFLLFGSVDELAEFGVKENHHLKLVNNADISVNLSHVAECSILIGSDSAFKTMSAMLKIPTVVWVGDYRDDFRDVNFINPYVKAGVMTVFRYRNLSFGYEVATGVNFSLEQVPELLLNA